MFKPGTKVRVRSGHSVYAVKPLTAGIVEKVEPERGEFLYLCRWTTNPTAQSYMLTYIPEAAIELLPDST